MSYSITVYCNDETIKQTKAYVPYLGNTYSHSYGDSSLGEYEEFTVGGLGDTWSVQFSVTPADGCSFYRWVYRLGSSDGTVKYSYSETFTYTGGEDIYIRAEGQDETDSGGWTLKTKTVSNIKADKNYSIDIVEKQLLRYEVSFAYSGTAKFYTTRSVDTYGYLSVTTDYDASRGIPNSYLAEDDNSGKNNINFSISYDVVAGKTYYVWIRGCSSSDSGSSRFWILAPSEPTQNSIEKWSWTKSNGDATDTQTSDAYYAVKNKTKVTDFSYIVWNDMVDKVKEILDEIGEGWDTTFTTFANAKISYANKTLTADKFNSLRSNIGNNFSTGISRVYTGDVVYGDYFLTLADCINAWIDTI